jgi:hypothetical protein
MKPVTLPPSKLAIKRAQQLLAESPGGKAEAVRALDAAEQFSAISPSSSGPGFKRMTKGNMLLDYVVVRCKELTAEGIPDRRHVGIIVEDLSHQKIKVHRSTVDGLINLSSKRDHARNRGR